MLSHFSAIVEGCLIGDKAIIGKKTKVKSCLIAQKVEVQDGQTLEDEEIDEWYSFASVYACICLYNQYVFK